MLPTVATSSRQAGTPISPSSTPQARNGTPASSVSVSASATPSGSLCEEGDAAERLRQQQVEGAGRLLARHAARAREDADDNDDDGCEVEVIGAQEPFCRTDVGAAPERCVEGAPRQVLEAVPEFPVLKRDHHGHEGQGGGGDDAARTHTAKRLPEDGEAPHAEPSRS